MAVTLWKSIENKLSLGKYVIEYDVWTFFKISGRLAAPFAEQHVAEETEMYLTDEAGNETG